MAQIPNGRKVKKLLKKSTREDYKKSKSQIRQGKAFINHGQGNIPEKIWKNLPGKRTV